MGPRIEILGKSLGFLLKGLWPLDHESGSFDWTRGPGRPLGIAMILLRLRTSGGVLSKKQQKDG